MVIVFFIFVWITVLQRAILKFAPLWNEQLIETATLFMRRTGRFGCRAMLVWLKVRKTGKKNMLSWMRVLGQFFVLKNAPAFVFWKNSGRHNFLLKLTDHYIRRENSRTALWKYCDVNTFFSIFFNIISLFFLGAK